MQFITCIAQAATALRCCRSLNFSRFLKQWQLCECGVSDRAGAQRAPAAAPACVLRQPRAASQPPPPPPPSACGRTGGGQIRDAGRPLHKMQAWVGACMCRPSMQAHLKEMLTVRAAKRALTHSGSASEQLCARLPVESSAHGSLKLAQLSSAASSAVLRRRSALTRRSTQHKP